MDIKLKIIFLLFSFKADIYMIFFSDNTGYIYL